MVETDSERPDKQRQKLVLFVQYTKQRNIFRHPQLNIHLDCSGERLERRYDSLSTFTWIASVNVLNVGMTRFHLDYSGGYVEYHPSILPGLLVDYRPLNLVDIDIHLDSAPVNVLNLGRSNSFPSGLFGRVPHQFCLEACLDCSSW
jgi:hypothetical protein